MSKVRARSLVVGSFQEYTEKWANFFQELLANPPTLLTPLNIKKLTKYSEDADLQEKKIQYFQHPSSG
jgi:hypothetical protein